MISMQIGVSLRDFLYPDDSLIAFLKSIILFVNSNSKLSVDTPKIKTVSLDN
jgi:hypothetical protein